VESRGTEKRLVGPGLSGGTNCEVAAIKPGDPSAARPALARSKRKKKPATPVGMIAKETANRTTRGSSSHASSSFLDSDILAVEHCIASIRGNCERQPKLVHEAVAASQ
jgi:hypothetical protein